MIKSIFYDPDPTRPISEIVDKIIQDEHSNGWEAEIGNEQHPLWQAYMITARGDEVQESEADQEQEEKENIEKNETAVLGGRRHAIHGCTLQDADM